MHKTEQTIVDDLSDDVKEPTIRQWYASKTRRAIRSLIAGTVTLFVVAIVFFVAAPEWLILKLQLFNGAITIPAAGGVWLVSFTLVWLLPMREVSFRSFEAMENTRLQMGRDLATIKRDATKEINEAKREVLAKMDEKMRPWVELGERLNKRLGDDFIDVAEKALRTAGELSEPAGPAPLPRGRLPKPPREALSKSANGNKETS